MIINPDSYGAQPTSVAELDAAVDFTGNKDDDEFDIDVYGQFVGDLFTQMSQTQLNEIDKDRFKNIKDTLGLI